VAVTIEGVAIQGTIEGVMQGGRLEYRFGKLRPVDRVSSWIRHLVWQTTTGERNGVTRSIAEDRTMAYRPVPDPEAVLAELLKFFRVGLREPLPFLPDPSYNYAVHWHKRQRPTPNELVREIAAKDLRAHARGRVSVAGDPYVSLYWPRGRFFDAAFGEVSLAVCAPMMANETK
jgi:exodeoxyribonuclease V gamma subunit